MTPFLQSTGAQNIIDAYINAGGFNQTMANDDIRNPIFDIRTEQEKAGTLKSTDLYPNPQLDFSAEDEIVDPCQEGYMLVDGICQPIETFGKSMYDEKQDREDRVEERPYYSSEEMSEMSDFDLINYLKDGWIKNHPLGYLQSKGDEFTVGGTIMHPLLNLAFGKSNEARRNFIIDELTKRGFYSGKNEDDKSTFNINPLLFQENVDDAVKNIITVQDQPTTITGQEKGQGTKPSDDSSYLLKTNREGKRERDEKAYQQALQQNIINTVKSPTSKYSKKLGGFYGGR